MKIVALSGSARAPSSTTLALDVAAAAAASVGGQVTRIVLAEWKLPIFDGEESAATDPVVRFKAAVKECDGLIVATPVFHDSMTGALKNAFDFLYDELQGKVAGLIAVAGGRTGHGQALEHVRAVLRETGTWVLPRQVPIGMSKEAFDETGQPRDPETASRLVTLGKEVVVRAKQLRPPARAAAPAGRTL